MKFSKDLKAKSLAELIKLIAEFETAGWERMGDFEKQISEAPSGIVTTYVQTMHRPGQEAAN